tara:strand:+ start:802 stop:1092 length:291 start_codon:yes stop_codon:yes gene_type:complete
MSNLTKNKLNKVYTIFLIISGIIYLIPTKLLIAVYTPSFLGWLLVLFIIPITLILLIWLSILDIKKKDFIKLTKRLFVFLLVIGLSFGFKHLIKNL